MIRRTSMLVTALAGVLVVSGCSTFTDADTVARVGDAELTRDDLSGLVGDTAPELEELLQLGSLSGSPDDDGGGDGDGSISGDLAGQLVTFWVRNETLGEAIADAGGEVTEEDRGEIQQQIDNNPQLAGMTEPFKSLVMDLEANTAAWTRLHTDTEYDAEAAREAYQQGMAASGFACLGAILTGTQDEANDAISRIEGGADFTEVAGEVSVQPESALGCAPVAELEQSLPPDMLDAARNLEVADDAVTDPIELPAQDGTPLWVVLTHLPFDDVSGEVENMFAQRSEQAAQQEAFAELASYSEDTDVYVHPRYGTYSPQSGVRPLAETTPETNPAPIPQ